MESLVDAIATIELINLGSNIFHEIMLLFKFNKKLDFFLRFLTTFIFLHFSENIFLNFPNILWP